MNICQPPKKLPPLKKKIKSETSDVPRRSTRTRTKPRKYDEYDTQKDVRSPPKTRSKTNNKVYSHNEKSVKKKAEAFQKLIDQANNIPIKAARSKRQSEGKGKGETRPSFKTKSFMTLRSKFMPKRCSTSKIDKIHPGKQLDTSVGIGDPTTKSVSALKASQAEEKRRKREEKQLKAQQRREILEKEYKQAITEKEERLQKKEQIKSGKKMREMEEWTDETRDENELARQKRKQKRQQRAQLMRDLPLHMTTEAPLLPTDDCYDSDDSDYGIPHKNLPDWGKNKEMYETLIPLMAPGEEMKNTLFCPQTQTPDLQEIFVCIDPRKLKRTSSAIWRKPPRYTLFTATNDTRFSGDFEEDIDD
ncbi:hypothetical protein JTB14_007583 [Gonioctena quinquepunctata]|nr:hypothetical protein JTB14_007583 [Gonioctena quinquepunctata]